jgi:hypothetical protein
MNIDLRLAEITVQNLFRIFKIMLFDETLIAIPNRHQMALNYSCYFFWWLPVARMAPMPRLISRRLLTRRSWSITINIILICWVPMRWYIEHSSWNHNSVILTLIRDYQLNLILLLVEWSLNWVPILLNRSNRSSTTVILVVALVYWLLNGFLFRWNRWIENIVLFRWPRLFPLLWAIKNLVIILC